MYASAHYRGHLDSYELKMYTQPFPDKDAAIIADVSTREPQNILCVQGPSRSVHAGLTGAHSPRIRPWKSLKSS